MTDFPALPEGFELEPQAARLARRTPPRLPAGFQMEDAPAQTPQTATAPAANVQRYDAAGIPVGGLEPPGTPVLYEEKQHADPLRRSTLLPLSKNRETGEVEWAVPQMALDIADAVTLPGDVYRGEVDPLSDEGLSRGFGLAGLAAGGTMPGRSGRLVNGAGKAVPKTVIRALRDDGVPLNEVGGRVQELGPAGVVADLGSNLRDKSAAIATTPGAAQKVVVDTLRARQQTAPARLTGALDETLGEAPIPSYVQREIRDNQKALSPEYQNLFANAGPVDTTALAASLTATIPTVRGKAQSELQAVRAMLNRTGSDELDTSPATLFQVRRALDGMLKGESDTNVTRELGRARADVDALLAASVPGIKQVDARFAELARQSDAVDRGQTVLGSGRTDPRPAELADEAAAGAVASGEVIGPSGVTFRLRQGARAEIDRIVGTNLNDRAALNSLLKGNSDWNYQRLVTLFGADKTDRLYRILDNERAMAETENKALAGSKTASLQAAQREISGPAKRPGVVRSAANLKVGDASAELLDAIFGGLTERRRGSRNVAIADTLMGRGDFTDPGRMIAAPIVFPMAVLLEAIMGDSEEAQQPPRPAGLGEEEMMRVIMGGR